MSEYAVITDGLTKFYGDTPVVRRLDLKIPKGCVYGLLGRNGAGKSTTIKMLTGMVIPDFGHATLLGEDAREMSPTTRARIAYVAEGHPLYRMMTISQLERFTESFYENWNGDLFGQIIDHFQLSRKRRVWRMSRGQRAQIALALAIAPDPELLILDDPTLGLDTVVRRDMLESLIQLIQREGRTILFSSHILGDVERVADRIGIMVDGVLRVAAPTDHFKQMVQRVVLTFDDTPPPLNETEGILSNIVNGHRRELTIIGLTDERRNILEALNPKVIDIVDLNLEDAFIEYTRGERRPLPLLNAPAKRGQTTVTTPT
ncbi:MAG: ABC transporter ATP-binding protein [Planctomycetaceae bacterium]|nr:ABC transporter ATP-binding protein [Planctomycetaceae bacterium]